MKKYMTSNAMRFFFLFASCVIWIGLWLTGFSVVHWLLYVPATLLAFAAITGICPGLIFSQLLFSDKPKA